MGCDPSGLGCWMWTCFWGKHAHHTHIITCYHLVKNDKGPLSVYNQYFLQHQVDQCPIQQYMTDLQSAIEQWQDDSDLLIVGSDWNEEVSSPSWQAFWNNLGLVTLDGLIQ